MPSKKAVQSRGRPEPMPTLGQHVTLLDIERIEPHPDNPRDDFSDNDPELRTLAASLTDNKLLHPISVIHYGDGTLERYRIVTGERRWRAAKLAGWRVVPGFILRVSPETATQLMVDENLQRKDLNAIETARALALLVKPKSKGGAGLTHAEVAAKFNHRGQWATRMLALVKLPLEWQERVATGEIEIRCGYELARYADRPEVLAAVERDRELNPQAWRGSAAFEAKLRDVVRRLDGPSCSSARVSDVRRQTEPPAADDERSDEAGEANDPASALAAILEVVDLLGLPELDRLGAYVADRRRQLSA